ncbi:unnamed protein product [Cuscuta europaea]|uniref:Uncharacterized protein n=1 Tax=Cuscuta europaea TaxID=41803 RepID=A0A9P0ZY39_CUSEU|nr:unnamed protein product [Cuscuta europaea]
MSSHSASANTRDKADHGHLLNVEEVASMLNVAPLSSVKRRKGGKRRCRDEVSILAENGPFEATCALTDDDWAEARRLAGPTVDIIKPDVGSLSSYCPRASSWSTSMLWTTGCVFRYTRSLRSTSTRLSYSLAR